VLPPHNGFAAQPRQPHAKVYRAWSTGGVVAVGCSGELCAL
jgi:hypothetical protein